jgi:large subunit ribosomal protein L22
MVIETGRQMEVTATARFIRVAPRKMGLVCDMVRGKRVEDAFNILHFSPKAASVPLEKLIRSAMSNLLQQEGSKKVDTEKVMIGELVVNEGPTLRRFRPRAMGRATRIRKRTSHIKVKLEV